MAEKNIAVIGSGTSGLVAIKCCKDEGLIPFCFERTNYIGGLWHFTPEAEEGQACVMKSTIINSSKEMMSFSDFPVPKEFATYMHNKYVQKYFHQYADHFDLKRHIRFKTEVLSIIPSDTSGSTGQWKVKVRDTSTQVEEVHTFDGVLICTGHHAEKKMPHFRGMDEFQGKIVHSHDYKDYRGYEDKRVVVLGMGNSGGDVAVELSKISSQVYLSGRRGGWIFHRLGKKGRPQDTNGTRFAVAMNKIIPGYTNSLKKKDLNNRFDHKLFCLQPEHDPFSHHPMVNDDLPYRILAGHVIVKQSIREFTKTGVVFEDGTHEQVDAVIMATGYIFGFPFLDRSVIEVKDNQVNLYKYMFPPDLTKPTLAVIGCVQPLGALLPISELQCRLAARVFKGDAILPSKSDMWQEIRHKQKLMSLRYVKSTRHTIQVDIIPFMDELAELIGCRPNLKRLMMTDPKLAYHCFFGPCLPYQYRIMGPGAWEGAREAILTVWDRYTYPLQTRPINVQDEPNSLFGFPILITAILSVMLYMLFL